MSNGLLLAHLPLEPELNNHFWALKPAIVLLVNRMHLQLQWLRLTGRSSAVLNLC
jgi:hypothetical protein